MLWAKFWRKYLCHRGVHSYNKFPGDGGGMEGIGGHYATWWSAPRTLPDAPKSVERNRTFARHCKHCGKWKTL